MKDLDTVVPILNVNRQVVDPRDYLRPFYGSVPQAVRQIYVGSVGWYQADPTQLRPTPPEELARRYVTLMGGGKRVNDSARSALGSGDAEFAAELTTLVITAHRGDKDADANADFKEAKLIKARALIELGARAENPNWRNWYITAAHELQGYPFPKAIKGGLVSPGVVGALPAGAWVNSLTMRLRAEVTAPEPGQKSLGFWFPPPSDQGFGPFGFVLIVRGGIAEFVEKRPRRSRMRSSRPIVNSASRRSTARSRTSARRSSAGSIPSRSLCRRLRSGCPRRIFPSGDSSMPARVMTEPVPPPWASHEPAAAGDRHPRRERHRSRHSHPPTRSR
jgi:hypothetical protein